MRSSVVKSIPLVTCAQYFASCVRSGTCRPAFLGGSGSSRVVEQRRRRGCKAPCAWRRVEDVSHGPRQRVIEVQRREAQNLFDRAHEVERIVQRGDHRVLLHVSARHEGDAAVGIDVVGAVLRVVFYDITGCEFYRLA